MLSFVKQLNITLQFLKLFAKRWSRFINPKLFQKHIYIILQLISGIADLIFVIFGAYYVSKKIYDYNDGKKFML